MAIKDEIIGERQIKRLVKHYKFLLDALDNDVYGPELRSAYAYADNLKIIVSEIEDILSKTEGILRT